MQVSDFPEQLLTNPNTPTPAFIGGLLRSGLGRSARMFDSCEENVDAAPGNSLPVPLATAVKARIAESPAQATLAQDLVRKRYYRAGYRMVEDDGCPFPGSNRAPKYFPIVAVWGERVVGTVTLGVDSPAGLMVDDVHKGTADAIRAKGGRLCELVRLATETDVDSKSVLASLLQCVYTTCTGVFDLTDVVIEVVPQHVPFYCRLLGFTPASEIRLCERVGGVASMVLSLERSELERRLRSLYKH
jgi:hypothetical protein